MISFTERFEDLLEIGQRVALINGTKGTITKILDTTIPKRFELDSDKLYQFCAVQMVYEFNILYLRTDNKRGAE